MAVFTLKGIQYLPVPMETAWAFFSAPGNLKEITPSEMGFDIRSFSGSLEAIFPGQVITYTVRPVFNIPLFWMTEITQVREGAYFIDEQRVGPYALWHHEHHFKAVPGGVEMTDLVYYRLPLGWLGLVAHWLFVRRQLQAIFTFRWQVLEQRFGKMPGRPKPLLALNRA